MAINGAQKEKHVKIASNRIIYNPDVIELPSLSLFQASKSGSEVSLARGSACFFEHCGTDFVLKRYFRGGAVSKLSERRYVYMGLDRTRMLQEFRLLQYLLELDLPVPVPAAVLVERALLFYSGCLITKRIHAEGSLATLAAAQQLPHKMWRQIGESIAKFHMRGVFHSDLNAENILLTGKQIFLIDFDKCYVEQDLNEVKRTGNLLRLKRSLEKLKVWKVNDTNSDQDWQALLAGYHSLKK